MKLKKKKNSTIIIQKVFLYQINFLWNNFYLKLKPRKRIPQLLYKRSFCTHQISFLWHFPTIFKHRNTGELPKVNKKESSFPDLIHPLDKPFSRILIERANGAFFPPVLETDCVNEGSKDFAPVNVSWMRSSAPVCATKKPF